jgi:multicomponent Na+:H+ antiporter subunit G
MQAGAVVLCVTGAFFFLVGTLGILRLPDFYTRTHAATKCDTVGACSILLGLAMLQGLDVVALKLVALAALILLSSPTAGHALARAAYRTGLVPWQRPGRETGGDAS